MPSRNAARWNATPNTLRIDEFIDSRIYSEPAIFEEELERTWKKTWLPVCHESELPEPYDFRTFTIAHDQDRLAIRMRSSTIPDYCTRLA